LFDETPVFREHPGVVHADPRADQSAEGLPEGRREPERTDRIRNFVTLLAADHLDARHRLCSLERGELREVHDVDRRLARVQQVFYGLVHEGRCVGVVQRHRAVDTGDEGCLAAGALRQVIGELPHVAEGRRHQQELHSRKSEQRHLPRPAPFWICVVVELIHDDEVDVGVRSLSQRDVREDFRRAADDRGVRVHRRVARHHSDICRAEDVDEGEELLRHERLDRRGVERALALSECREVRADRDERLTGARRRAEHDVVARDKLDERLGLRRVEAQPALE
jgi:hypothetical protein